jgi:hypothetical protein
MATKHLVPALFADRKQAEAAIADLRAAGVPNEAIGIVVPDPGTYEVHDPSAREAAAGLVRGVAVGTTVGTLAGIALSAVVFPGVGPLGVGGLFLIGVHAGSLLGAVLGGYGGLVVTVRPHEDHDRFHEIPVGSGEVLVVVDAADRASQVRELLEAAGAECFMDEAERLGPPRGAPA